MKGKPVWCTIPFCLGYLTSIAPFLLVLECVNVMEMHNISTTNNSIL